MISTSYLVLFLFLGAVGIGTAFALITITLSGNVEIIGDLDMTNGKISNLVTPSAPTDAATKGYVDSAPGTDTLALLGCSTDQVARWNGIEWACSSISVIPLPITIVGEIEFGSITFSLAIVNGKPASSYAIPLDSLFVLNYVQASDTDGTSWNTPVTVVSNDSFSVGTANSLATVNGKPAIAYSEDSGNLKYIQASDTDGTSWNTPVTVVSEGTYQLSLAIVNGKPAIIYKESHPSNTIKYVQANDVGGTTWGTPVVVSDGGDNDSPSLTIVNGKPAVSYFDQTNTLLEYSQANDADGATWGTPVTVHNYSQNNPKTSLSVVNGKPAISFALFGGGGSILNYVQANDADGATWNTPLRFSIIDGLRPDIATVNGKPAISFQGSDRNLYYVQALNADGTSWKIPITVDSGKNNGFFPSLIIVNGTPAITYIDSLKGQFKFVKAHDVDGDDWSFRIIFE